MDILLSADQRRFKEECRIFAENEIAPLAAKYGETDDIPGELVRAMADAQLFRLLVPEETGGRGVKSMPICLVREQLAGVYCVADVTFAMQGLGSYPIVLAGNGEQKARFLTRLGSGEILSTYALTEPEAGSDVSAITSRARETDGGFVLNGLKRFISNGNAADIAVTFAKTPLPGNARALSALVVEKRMEGFRVHKRLKAIAPHDLVELEFADCFVPRENLLGSVGDGMKIALKTLDRFRVSVGAAALGIAQVAFGAAVDYAKQRVQFGRPIAGFQGTQFKLADMATELDAARALVYRAALLQDAKGDNITRAASMAKMYATEAAFRIVDQSLQIHGGMGVMAGSTIERLYREIRALRIYEGTTEIQKLIIAKSLTEG
ncbi:MAG TPA: acyl-CoA dehydrogenase [Syntrophus sp. (in: bacteria)]|nr:acyl-CoA dehydrogenase [Syntrophus sp. (in: bacteria)]